MEIVKFVQYVNGVIIKKYFKAYEITSDSL